MNILVFDDRNAITHVVRAALAGGRHRVSISTTAEDARLKVDTALFDALVIGPGGAPRELADHVEKEWPALPLVLAGVSGDVPVADPIVAVLKAPLRIEALIGAVRKLESREAAGRRKIYDMPLDVIAGERRLRCRVVLAGKETLLLERLQVEGEEPGDLRGERFVSLSRFGETVESAVAFAEHSPRGLKYLGVRLDGDSARRVLEASPIGAVPSFPMASAGHEEDPLDFI